MPGELKLNFFGWLLGSAWLRPYALTLGTQGFLVPQTILKGGWSPTSGSYALVGTEWGRASL